jgi:hypothetical protein
MVLPFVPLHGSASAPLTSLLAWHAEISAAEHEHTAAAATLDVAANVITPVVLADHTIFILISRYHRYILWVITPMVLADHTIFILVS